MAFGGRWALQGAASTSTYRGAACSAGGPGGLEEADVEAVVVERLGRAAAARDAGRLVAEGVRRAAAEAAGLAVDVAHRAHPPVLDSRRAPLSFLRLKEPTSKLSAWSYLRLTRNEK